ncbi:kinase-like domain-containing protein, partial [Hyaloraphidium curvatum]
FAEMEFLGKGGFGAVYRSRNRLDGQEYAIKKIRLKCPPARGRSRRTTCASSARSRRSREFRTTPTWCGTTTRGKRDRSGDRRTEASTILFIQMQLCSPSNLHKWLQARNGARSVVVDPQTNLQIFRQICSGLAHVHNGGFIHRDIKPANVFLEGDHVFLGDFGLAKDISQRARHGGDQDAEDAREFWNEMTNLTLGVGTLLYASPEQLSRRRYDSKTDIYSLGVLFFELYYPFASAVERVYTLMELRKGVVPHSFRARYPSEWMLLRRMIAHDPKDRPTANEIM